MIEFSQQKPQKIKKEGSNLIIEWQGASVSSLEISRVRKACACAVCREQKVPLDESMSFFPRATTLQKMEIVGNYALAITWGDGHRSIYAFESLKDLEKKVA